MNKVDEKQKIRKKKSNGGSAPKLILSVFFGLIKMILEYRTEIEGANLSWAKNKVMKWILSIDNLNQSELVMM